MRSRASDSGVHLAELMAALSIATDLGMGQPLESALCSCVVAMRLGEAPFSVPPRANGSSASTVNLPMRPSR